jgi:hypothetical protein
MLLGFLLGMATAFVGSTMGVALLAVFSTGEFPVRAKTSSIKQYNQFQELN